MLKIRSFKKGADEAVFVDIFNACFGDYDDIRMMTLEELGKMMEAPGYNADGLFIAEWNGKPAGMVDAYTDRLDKQRNGIIQYLSFSRIQAKGNRQETPGKGPRGPQDQGHENHRCLGPV